MEYERSVLPGQDDWTSYYIDLTIERARELKELKKNLETFVNISEELILKASEVHFLLNQLEYTRADIRSTELQLNTLAQRLGVEPLVLKNSEKKWRFGS